MHARLLLTCRALRAHLNAARLTPHDFLRSLSVALARRSFSAALARRSFSVALARRSFSVALARRSFPVSNSSSLIVSPADGIAVP
jgi:hypothetical protein